MFSYFPLDYREQNNPFFTLMVFPMSSSICNSCDFHLNLSQRRDAGTFLQRKHIFRKEVCHPSILPPLNRDVVFATEFDITADYGDTGAL